MSSVSPEVSRPLLESPAGNYIWHENWVATRPFSSPGNGRTHGICVSRSNHVIVFQQAFPSVLIFDLAGNLQHSWGDYPGAHGLTLVEEGQQEFLWLTDQERVVVEKVTLQGQVVQSLPSPPYAAREPYVPTWAAVNETRFGGNGDVWVADGYGSNRVNRYDANGSYLSSLDGMLNGKPFACPHGIWFDSRKHPTELYVADRSNRRVQVFNPEGGFLRSFGTDFLTSPDGFSIDGDRLLIPELESRLTILDACDQFVASLGVNDTISADPAWPDSTPLVPGKFNAPHAATAHNGDLYVVEWRVGGRVIKLQRV